MGLPAPLFSNTTSGHDALIHAEKRLYPSITQLLSRRAITHKWGGKLTRAFPDTALLIDLNIPWPNNFLEMGGVTGTKM